MEKGLSSRQQRETKPEQSTPAAKRLTAASPAACFSGVPMSPAAAGSPPLAASAFRRSENCRGVSKPPHLYGMPVERMPGFHHAPASSPAAEASGVSVRMPSPVRSVADIPERAPPNHGGIGPAGCQGFTAGDGRSGRRNLRYSRNTGPQAGGEDEQRQGMGHAGSMASGLRGGKDDCRRAFFIQGTDGLEA